MTDKPEASPHHRADVAVSQDADKVTLKAPAGGATLTADEAQELASRIFEAAMLANGDDPEENDWVRVPMQYVRVAAERMEFNIDGGEAVSPNPDPEMGDAKNAEVHCWIKDQTLRNAMHIAAGSIAEHGWVIGEVIEQRPVSRADFTDPEYLQYFEQALIDSEVFLYELEETEGDETEGTADAS
ncbi:MAG: hypothetical protein J0I06_06335 [Planctomycetes bacterium]|nr:hypothetical protein [Planctomycetota bacterium]